jgi:hypothetical protein
MNARIAIFLAALVVLATAAYLELKPAGPADFEPGKAAGAAGKDAPAMPRIVALAPGVAPATHAAPARAKAAPVRATLFNEYLHAKSYRTLYDRLRSSPEGGTAEGLYVTYDILKKCAKVSDRPYRWRGQQQKSPEQAREEFLKALAPDDPLRDKRIAAFEGASVNHCVGFDDVTVAQADLDKLLSASANAGDPKAKAATVEQEIWQARRSGQWRTATLSDTQISTLEQAIGTKDPEAMVMAGRLLSNTWPDITLRLGSDPQAVEPRAFYNAWQVLACDYGYPCGADNQRLLDECAYNAHCDAASLPDYLSYYASSPHDMQLVSQYEAVLRGAIENGDWSQLAVTRGAKMPGTGYVFGHPG